MITMNFVQHQQQLLSRICNIVSLVVCPSAHLGRTGPDVACAKKKNNFNVFMHDIPNPFVNCTLVFATVSDIHV